MCVILYSNEGQEFEVSVFRLLSYQSYQQLLALAIDSKLSLFINGIIVKLFLSVQAMKRQKRVRSGGSRRQLYYITWSFLINNILYISETKFLSLADRNKSGDNYALLLTEQYHIRDDCFVFSPSSSLSFIRES